MLEGLYYIFDDSRRMLRSHDSQDAVKAAEVVQRLIDLARARGTRNEVSSPSLHPLRTNHSLLANRSFGTRPA